MARYKPIDMVKHYQGKICNPRDLAIKPYKPAEIATHNKFRQAIQAVAALTEEQFAAYKTAFEKQLQSPHPKYSYLRNYMIAQAF